MEKTLMQKDKEKFIDFIKHGEWLTVTVSSGSTFLVKLKGIKESMEIQALWLSYLDPEGITLNEYQENNWSFLEDTLRTFDSFDYHVGSIDGEGKDSIYHQTDGHLEEPKLFQVILENAPKDFITESELKNVWEDVKNQNFTPYANLKIAE